MEKYARDVGNYSPTTLLDQCEHTVCICRSGGRVCLFIIETLLALKMVNLINKQ